MFVIAAIVLERNLQNVANYLILSLAVADLLVAVLVMPLGAVYEVGEISIIMLRPSFLGACCTSPTCCKSVAMRLSRVSAKSLC